MQNSINLWKRNVEQEQGGKEKNEYRKEWIQQTNNNEHEESIWRNHVRQRKYSKNMQISTNHCKTSACTPESTMKSSLDTEEMPESTEEVERTIKRMKRHKSPWNGWNYKWYHKTGSTKQPTYEISSITYWRQSTYLTVGTKQKIVILFKMGDPKDIKYYGPTSLQLHSYKTFIRLLQTRTDKKSGWNSAKRASRIS